ncbi:hypothetical protein GCM10022251_36770 [Phytohabitans flavus]|uniref:RNA polymerase sigma factor n=1 Tax=Phytohabitans flavus TaxID=1076124 RepID=A0A6F8XW24_9ACTN|nr:hypothetical protein Pflav_044300 [Phytohabitans flavus]
MAEAAGGPARGGGLVLDGGGAVAHQAGVVGEVWRRESARIVAGLARMLAGDAGLAEELAQDALVAALEQWPVDGVPDNPGAWLTTVARRRAVDTLRLLKRRDRGQVVSV